LNFTYFMYMHVTLTHLIVGLPEAVSFPTQLRYETEPDGTKRSGPGPGAKALANLERWIIVLVDLYIQVTDL
jgi:hypothetical protein